MMAKLYFKTPPKHSSQHSPICLQEEVLVVVRVQLAHLQHDDTIQPFQQLTDVLLGHIGSYLRARFQRFRLVVTVFPFRSLGRSCRRALFLDGFHFHHDDVFEKVVSRNRWIAVARRYQPTTTYFGTNQNKTAVTTSRWRRRTALNVVVVVAGTEVVVLVGRNIYEQDLHLSDAIMKEEDDK